MRPGNVPLTRRERGKKQPLNSALRRKKEELKALQLSYDKLVDLGRLKPIEQWDIEELSRGKPRNRNGGFSGSAPTWLTPLVQEEVQKRFKQAGTRELMRHFPKAVQTLVELLDSVDPKVRLQASSLLLEYTMGKPKVSAEVASSSPYERMLATALVMGESNQIAAHPVDIPGTIVEGEVLQDVTD